MKILTGHTSLETAYKVENYPYGFKLMTTLFAWIETIAKKGDRFCTQTINPKNGRHNAPKKSTFSNIGHLYLDEKGHIHWAAVTIYSKREQVENLVNSIGIENLLPEQKKMFNQLMGINEVKIDEFTGKVKKDFSVKWEKDNNGKCDEVRITFDRPDGVKIKEIFKAMKSLNQDKLNEVFEIRESQTFGSYPGTVRICTRGGSQLGTVKEDSYKEFLASDYNQNEEGVEL